MNKGNIIREKIENVVYECPNCEVLTEVNMKDWRALQAGMINVCINCEEAIDILDGCKFWAVLREHATETATTG